MDNSTVLCQGVAVHETYTAYTSSRRGLRLAARGRQPKGQKCAVLRAQSPASLGTLKVLQRPCCFCSFAQRHQLRLVAKERDAP